MRFQTPLVPARLLRRYKRFLADMRLADGREVIAHCPNPGAMLGLRAPGLKCWLEPNDDARKKLRYGWRLVEHDSGDFTCVDTGLANRVVGEALRAGRIEALRGYDTVRPEVRYGTASRVDFLLTQPALPNTYVEVKSVTLRRHGRLAEFPDSVTTRGSKHLRELAGMVTEGHRAVMLYLVQRTDCDAVGLAGDIDPAYLRSFATARAAGIEVICHGASISPKGLGLGKPLAFVE